MACTVLVKRWEDSCTYTRILDCGGSINFSLQGRTSVSASITVGGVNYKVSAKGSTYRCSRGGWLLKDYAELIVEVNGIKVFHKKQWLDSDCYRHAQTIVDTGIVSIGWSNFDVDDQCGYKLGLILDVQKVKPPNIYVFSISFDREPVLVGETVTITATVINTGGLGSATIVFKANGVEFSRKTVSLNQNESRQVSAQYTPEQAGAFQICVEAL